MSVTLGFDSPTFFHQAMGVITVKNLIKDKITTIINRRKEFKMKNLVCKSIMLVSAIVGCCRDLIFNEIDCKE